MTELEYKNLEEFDKLKTRVLKYVLYKKRTEREIRQKFAENAGNLLDNVIKYLTKENYINDEIYIQRSINEIKNLKNMSIKEIKYKLISKGIAPNLVDEYIYSNEEEMLDYELNSAKTIILKKSNLMDEQEVLNFLRKKGYREETIRMANNQI